MARTSRKHRTVIAKTNPVIMKTALYVRLSNEDNGGRGKDSIINQMELLRHFAQRIEEIEIEEVYVDNGQTGTDFERPEWERLMEDIRQKKINCIIVKDLSRFGRNYLEAGDYLEKIFPFLGVRFVAVNDRYDSAGEWFPKKDFVTEIQNLANDYYSKDISRKIMSAFKTKKEQGQFIGNRAPYGYILKDNRFFVDEPAASVVRRIFSLKLEGNSSYEIAGILNRENVASPSRYAKENGARKYRNSQNILWQPQAINRILYNQVYAGDLIQGKYNTSIYSRERKGKREEEVWEVTENAHEAIVTKEVFYQVQEIKRRNREARKNKEKGPSYENVLEGILVCGACGRPLRRNKDVRNGKARYYFYCASAYNYKEVPCNTSSVADYKIFDTVLKLIRLQIDLAVEAEIFIKKMRESDSLSCQYKDKKAGLIQIRERLQKYTYLKTCIYEDMKQGILTQEEYGIARERYALQIRELEGEEKKFERDLDDFERLLNKKNQWMEAFLSFRNTKLLTREMATELLDTVEVYENKRVHIKFRFRNEYEYLISQLKEMDLGRENYDGTICG